MVISASLQAWGGVFPFAMLTSICRSIVTICSGFDLLVGIAPFFSKWILSHSTWYKSRRSGQLARVRSARPESLGACDHSSAPRDGFGLARGSTGQRCGPFHRLGARFLPECSRHLVHA